MSAISLRDVIFDVPTKRVLKGITLDIEKGEIVSIMGASGSGKTTLLKLMCGLVRPTSGQIHIEDENIASLSELELDRVRLKMGLVFQYAALFDSLNVYDNIVFGVVRHRRRTSRRELDALVKELLEDVQLPGIEKQLPSELSGGMRKRVGLARALATKPSFLFYDEPTSGLDPITSYTIDQLIVETRDRHNVTTVIVSHHIPSIFRISDRVAMLHQGEIVALGPPKEVEASDNPIVQAFLHPETASESVSENSVAENLG